MSTSKKSENCGSNNALAIKRKLEVASADIILDAIEPVISEFERTHNDDIVVQIFKRLSVELTTSREYIQKAHGHDILKDRRTGRLARKFDKHLARHLDDSSIEKDPLDMFVSAHIVSTGYTQPTEMGKVRVGFDLDEFDLKRFTEERKSSINTLLDLADLPITDPSRQWRSEENEQTLWLPVASIQASDANEAEDLAEVLTLEMTDAIELPQVIKLMNARAIACHVQFDAS